MMADLSDALAKRCFVPALMIITSPRLSRGRSLPTSPISSPFKHQQDLIAFFVRLGLFTGRVPWLKRHHRRLRAFGRLQDLKPLGRSIDIRYVHSLSSHFAIPAAVRSPWQVTHFRYPPAFRQPVTVSISGRA